MADPRNRSYVDAYWDSPDGLRLHYRDFPGGEDGRPTILCLPGLTRNARDFADLGERLSPEWRVIAADLRGRGESAHAKDPASYTPATYVADVEALLTHLSIDRVVMVGTSLGGIVTMLLASAGRDRVAGALLNDIGPEIDPAGLSRIRGYVGRNSWHPTWLHAARALADTNADIYPAYGIDDWLAMAKRLYRLNAAGRIVLDYDMRIAEPFRGDAGEGPDLWRSLDALAGRPVLVLRGARSDILSARTADAMLLRLGGRAEVVTVPDVGHAPTLDEPVAIAAIDHLLARVREPVAA